MQNQKEKATKTIIIISTIFLLLKIINLFLADIAFAKGYRTSLAGNSEKALSLITEAIKLNKHEPTYYQELANAYCVLGKIDPCLKNASIALKLNPYNSLTLKALIKTFIRAGLFENATVLSQQLIEIAPSDEESRQLKNYTETLIINSK